MFKKDKKVIGFDVDGVLLDFYKQVCNYSDLEIEILDTWTTDEVNEVFYENIDNDVFWSTIPNLIDPSEIDFDFDFYISALPVKHAANRIKNLVENGFPYKPLIVSTQKHIDCKIYGIDIIIDDKLENILQCRKNGVTSLFYKPYYYSEEYAKKEYEPLTSMLEIKNKINGLQK